MNWNLLTRSLLLFGSLFIIGGAACLPLYGGQLRRLIRSTLWVKILWWIPIFSCLMIVAWLGIWSAVAIAAGLIILAGRELQQRGVVKRPLAIGYALLICLLLCSLPFYWQLPYCAGTLLCVCFSSALSDVCAYFGGRYLGKHALPAWINKGKAWEGVAGQLIGGVAGLLLTRWALDVTVTASLGLIIGVASAIGDLINSFVKRRLGFKDWGSTIPGHGGILDRFSSLSVALTASLWWLLL